MEYKHLVSPIGLIAGNGTLPMEFADNAREKGYSVVAIGHVGETDPSLSTRVGALSWVRVGQLGKVIRILRKAGVKQVAFAGGIRKPAFSGLRLDLTGFLTLMRAHTYHDDSLLRAIAREIERRGIEVFSPTVFLEQSVPAPGVLTVRALSKKEREDAIIGWEAAEGIGRFDIGQTVVVNEKVVVAVEALEGTDACLERAGSLRGGGATIVKLPKPGQDTRFDLPAIGVNTIDAMKRLGFTALVLKEGGAILIDPQGVIDKANAAGIAIIAGVSASSI